jgi:NADPH:quinone reductase-like Zn-dependent oxidoreductase
MVEAAALQAGDVVVVVGATGGVGSIALQLVAAAGARPIAVSRSVNHEHARGLGASETIDYEIGDVFDAVRAAHPDGVAAIFDMVGDKEVTRHLAELVRPDGHLVSMMGAADAEALAARGITGVNVVTQATTDELERLAAFVAAGSLRRPQIQPFPLAEAGHALVEIAGRHVRGKLVVVP